MLEEYFLCLICFLSDGGEFILQVMAGEDFSQEGLMWFNFGPVDELVHFNDIVAEGLSQGKGKWACVVVEQFVLNDAEGFTDFKEEWDSF